MLGRSQCGPPSPGPSPPSSALQAQPLSHTMSLRLQSCTPQPGPAWCPQGSWAPTKGLMGKPQSGAVMGPGHTACPGQSWESNLKSYKLPGPKGCPPSPLNYTALRLPSKWECPDASNSEASACQGWEAMRSGQGQYVLLEARVRVVERRWPWALEQPRVLSSASVAVA